MIITYAHFSKASRDEKFNIIKSNIENFRITSDTFGKNINSQSTLTDEAKKDQGPYPKLSRSLSAPHKIVVIKNIHNLNEKQIFDEISKLPNGEKLISFFIELKKEILAPYNSIHHNLSEAALTSKDPVLSSFIKNGKHQYQRNLSRYTILLRSTLYIIINQDRHKNISKLLQCTEIKDILSKEKEREYLYIFNEYFSEC